jgi:hypothetical protein
MLRMIEMVAEAAAASGKPVGVCGEAAADPLLALVLAGLGTSSLSMAPRALAEVGRSLAAVSLRRMVEIWRGDLGWPAALRSGSIQLQGPERLRRAVPKWFPSSHYAHVPRSAVDISALAG